jgi:hypothetical protein
MKTEFLRTLPDSKCGFLPSKHHLRVSGAMDQTSKSCFLKAHDERNTFHNNMAGTSRGEDSDGVLLG